MITVDTVSLCVPIVAENVSELKKALEDVSNSGVDLIEFRRDYLQNDDSDDIVSQLLRSIINQVEVIFTFRGYKEGGKTVIKDEDRFKTISKFLRDGCVTYLDIEEAASDLFFKSIESELLKNVKLILSAHNFDKTPESEEILEQLLRSNRRADIVKAAYTVHNKQDLNKLYQASKAFREVSNKPLILIGMGEEGQETRKFPELLNSNLSFTPLSSISGSAPGQLDFKTIKNLRESFNEKEKTRLLNRTHGFWEDDNR